MDITLASYQKRLDTINELLADPTVLRDQKRFIALNKEHKEISRIIACMEAIARNKAAQAANEKLLQEEKDQELLEMGKEEDIHLKAQAQKLEEELNILLIPKDPNDDKNVILELRAGTGGDEAALWVGDLFRMYERYCELKKWKLTLLDFTHGPSGGYKEIISTIQGEGAYGELKYESGVHRVQRVPATETQGRLHTSAASVVVLPEMDEVEVSLDMKDIRKETFCSSGPGGQSVNTTYSAVRLTHIPTGIVVSCQDGKSQLQNFEKAMNVLRARVNAQAKKEQQDAVSQERKSMVGSQDRSAKIRTYNYPRGAVTDHRIHYTNHNLTAMLNGDIADMIQALRRADQKFKNEK